MKRTAVATATAYALVIIPDRRPKVKDSQTGKTKEAAFAAFRFFGIASSRISTTIL
jgi:hypothetical protein